MQIPRWQTISSSVSFIKAKLRQMFCKILVDKQYHHQYFFITAKLRQNSRWQTISSSVTAQKNSPHQTNICAAIPYKHKEMHKIKKKTQNCCKNVIFILLSSLGTSSIELLLDAGDREIYQAGYILPKNGSPGSPDFANFFRIICQILSW